jgi:hypothetical protein
MFLNKCIFRNPYLEYTIYWVFKNAQISSVLGIVKLQVVLTFNYWEKSRRSRRAPHIQALYARNRACREKDQQFLENYKE